jgi:hypothetical protein
MKNAFIGILIVVLLVALFGILERPWPGTAIDLQTCQPDGPSAKLSRAWNPRSFWIEQNVTLEIALEANSLQELVDDCHLKDSGNTKKLAQCVTFYTERHAGMKKCLEFSALQCRREGGKC